MICSVSGCSVVSRARGMCKRHYERWRVHGDPDTLLTNYGVPVGERMAQRIVVQPDGCWLWTGYTDEDGYGIVKVDGQDRKAHRVAYALIIGPIPSGLQIDHLCRVHACVNPWHLEPVTAAENQRRGERGVLRTHCVNGHAYAGNVKLNNRGARVCAICARAACQRYREREAINA